MSGPAPKPFEVWQGGMFVGLMMGSQGRSVRSFDEAEIRSLFREWMEERAPSHDTRGGANDG